MTRKLLLMLLVLVLMPLALVAWLGVRLARDEQMMLRQQLRELLADQLNDTDQLLVRFFQQTEAEMLRLTTQPSYETDRLREVIRSEPRIRQLFVLDPEGQLLHPPLDQPRNAMESAFLQRAETIITDKDLIRAAAADSKGDASAAGQTQTASSVNSTGRTHGWHVWYWGRGVNLIFWRRDDAGNIVGVELDRARWIADLISQLPQSPPATRGDVPETVSRIQLVDSEGNVVYQWGRYEPPDNNAFVEAPVSAPLSSWRLKYFIAEERLQTATRGGLYFNLLAGVVAVAVALTALAVYIYRESSRELREAATRVSFVNQVSHELKTPLTNIRMYADLMHEDLQAIDGDISRRPLSRLQVIVSESQRLSRLIGNVLAFARQQRGRIAIKRSAGRIDDAIREVLQQFEPILADKQIETTTELAADREVMFDRDALEQILINLFSNVEKYAAGGRSLSVTSSQAGDTTMIIVADRGPGISAELCEQIFEPFVRASDRLESATGAGIGLSIARGLARQHGGDVVLQASDRGARFQISLLTPPAKTA